MDSLGDAEFVASMRAYRVMGHQFLVLTYIVGFEFSTLKR
jgi:hypothetical protein